MVVVGVPCNVVGLWRVHVSPRVRWFLNIEDFGLLLQVFCGVVAAHPVMIFRNLFCIVYRVL